eukprot:gene15194-biopygen5178
MVDIVAAVATSAACRAAVPITCRAAAPIACRAAAPIACQPPRSQCPPPPPRWMVGMQAGGGVDCHQMNYRHQPSRHRRNTTENMLAKVRRSAVQRGAGGGATNCGVLLGGGSSTARSGGAPQWGT